MLLNLPSVTVTPSNTSTLQGTRPVNVSEAAIQQAEDLKYMLDKLDLLNKPVGAWRDRVGVWCIGPEHTAIAVTFGRGDVSAEQHAVYLATLYNTAGSIASLATTRHTGITRRFK